MWATISLPPLIAHHQISESYSTLKPDLFVVSMTGYQGQSCCQGKCPRFYPEYMVSIHARTTLKSRLIVSSRLHFGCVPSPYTYSASQKYCQPYDSFSASSRFLVRVLCHIIPMSAFNTDHAAFVITMPRLVCSLSSLLTSSLSPMHIALHELLHIGSLYS